MNDVSRRVSTACVAALALAWPLAAAEPQVSGGVVGGVAVQTATPVQAIREQLVAIDSAAAGRGSATTLPMAGVSLTGSGLIVGQVVDASSGAPVANAIVSLGSTSLPAPVAGNPGRGGAAAPAPAGAASGGRGSAAPPTILRQLADSDGRFAFRHLPRGGYSITVTRPGYIDGAYGRLRPTGSPQPLELAEGERRSDVKVRVFKYAAITGMLREESGDPAVGVNVRAYRRTVVAGRAQLSATGGSLSQTDDRGIYRLANLTPGEYIVAVPFASNTSPSRLPPEMSPEMRAAMAISVQPGVPVGGGSIVPQTDQFVLSSTAVAFGATLESNGTILVTPTTYFPSALVVSQAQPITIGSGEERAGVDIVLRSSSATFISGRLVGPDGPGADWALNLVPTDTGDLTSDPQVATAVTDSDGAFMFLGIPAGSYVIQGIRISPQGGPRVTTTVVNGQPMLLSTTGSSPAAAQVPAQPTLWTATPVSVGPEGLRDLAVTLRRGFTVSGRVEFDGAAERPPAARLQTVTVTLEPADGRTRGVMPSARLDAGGQFTSGGYLPGKYVVRVLNPPGGWTLKSVMLGGTDVADLPLELDARDLSGLVVTFADRSTELQGSVRDPKGQPDDDAAVAVFPLDNRLWTNAGTASRRLRMSRVSTTGRFAFAGLPPGEYGVVAFSEEFAGEWPDARFIEQLSRAATRVTLADGGKQSVDLSRQTVRGGLIASKNTSGMFSGPTKNTSGMFFEANTELEDFSPNSTDSQPIEPAGSQKHTRRVFDEPQQRDARVEPAVASASAATISGNVIEDGSGQPIRRARVSVRATDARFDRAVMTDDAGRFAVSSVPPGRYSIIVTKPSYIAGYHGSKRPGRGPGTAIAVTAGQKAQVSITMARGAAITGVVRDESGAPMPNARVTAGIIRVQNGLRDIYQLGSAQTDDRGAYRIFGLAANNYYVFAAPSISTLDVRQLTSDDWQAVTSELRQSAAPAPAAAGAARTPPGRPVGFAPIFYPGTLSFADATAIPVGTGQEVTSIDLTARLVPTARIEGTVTAPDGRPLQGALLMMFPESLSTGFVTSITTQQDGRFASPFVPPGRYTVSVRANQNLVVHDHPAEVTIVAPVMRSFPAVPAGAPPPPPPPPPPPVPANQSNLYAEQAFDLAGENITGVSIVVQEGTTVSGRVQFEGSRAIAPGEAIQVRISMTTAVPTRSPFGSAATAAAINGAFTLNGVPPGKMRFGGQAISNQQGPNQPPVPLVAGWMLKSAILNGRDVLDLPLDVSIGRSVDGVVLTFTDRMAELSGAVLDAAGATNADLFVMLLPADRAYWAAPTSRRFRAPVTTGLDGRYRFPNLPAGDYLLVALGDVDGLDTTDSNVLEQLAAGGIKITIADGEKKTQDIRTR